jgi:hypothetical protein
MSITEDLLLSFSGCSSLAEIEDIVLRDQSLTSIQVGAQRRSCPLALISTAGSSALPASSDSVTGSQRIVAC